ncbi:MULTISPECIES: MarR family winged helix-turn-helix transcriptional regulator [Bacillaceae]|uniref:MarR family winged helix-turn-helix transcriptional regulator n=1 Tax=Bacillales TaxID=1385 RepID=UPI0018834B10|nr:MULTISPECIES: MarR family transcriptional regulator [Bacillaceae]MBF0709132.1 MarR family transcriptional regulator [Pseudalkalibacillus hwajinpoensis]MDO6655255.1 MarR family transcriptional regulator [Anaerobacillus sp. 1_MG-2023]
MNKKLCEAVELFEEVIMYGTERIIRSFEHQLFEEYSSEQLQMLQIISKSGRISPGKLASLQGVHKSAISNRYKKLEMKGLVVTVDSEEDLRGKSITLTEKGNDVVDLFDKVIYEHVEKIVLNDFHEEEIDEFLRIFRKLSSILKAEGDAK